MIGDAGTEATLYNLKLKKDSFDSKEFHSKMIDMFRDGAASIENVMIGEICRVFDIPLKERSWYDFPKYVELARKIYTSKQQ